MKVAVVGKVLGRDDGVLSYQGSCPFGAPRGMKMDSWSRSHSKIFVFNAATSIFRAAEPIKCGITTSLYQLVIV